MPRQEKADLIEQMLSEQRQADARVPLPGAAASTKAEKPIEQERDELFRDWREQDNILQQIAALVNDEHITCPADVLREVKVALALPSPPDGWQDISTAPKDGTPIIAISQIGNIYKMVYEDEGWFSRHVGRWLLPEEVAGWMPCPPPPPARHLDEQNRELRDQLVAAEAARDELKIQLDTAYRREDFVRAARDEAQRQLAEAKGEQ